MIVFVFVMVCVCAWLTPPQLPLSPFNANVTEPPIASPVLELSDAAPQPDDVPVTDIVPLKAEPVLFVMVTNPLSGLAQIVLLVLHIGPVPETSVQAPAQR